MEACKRTARQIECVVQAIKAMLKSIEEAAHFDETGARVDKKLWWLHVVCTRKLTYYAFQYLPGLDICGDHSQCLSGITKFKLEWFWTNRNNLDCCYVGNSNRAVLENDLKALRRLLYIGSDLGIYRDYPKWEW